jgi:hypothetical protein
LRKLFFLWSFIGLMIACDEGKKSLDSLSEEDGIIEEPGAENPLEGSEEAGNGEGAGEGVLPIAPADPPYDVSVIFPSGLRVDGLTPVPALSATYPSAGSSRFPFVSDQEKHYASVGYFMEIAALSTPLRQRQVAENFSLNEYVRIPERNGDDHIYIDAQIAWHAQQLRSAWGGPLILTSTYRSPEYNAAIGGATFSRHMYGDAVDIRADNEGMALDLYNLAKFLDVSYLDSPDQTILGRSTPWIHLDDRGWPLNTPATR